MKITNKQSAKTEKFVLLAFLTAIVAVLAYYGGFIKIGGLASISLTLIPVVVGATLLGPLAGAWLGAVAGAIFFATPDAVFWFGLSVPGTVVTVMVKGILSGLCAGLVYKALGKFNRYLAVLAAAIVCPVVNTGIFLVGCFIFFKDTIGSFTSEHGFFIGICVFVSLNFVFELIANIAVSPAIVRIIDLAKTKSNKQ